jgi:hypothetical protein
MSSSKKENNKKVCDSFCDVMGCVDCSIIGEGVHSIVYKATENKNSDNEKIKCFKIIEKTDYEKSTSHNINNSDISKIGECDIIKLLNQFFFFFFFYFI